jgi:hypothetical protein
MLFFTCSGILFMMYHWKKTVKMILRIPRADPLKTAIAVTLFLLYLLGPPLFMNKLEELDSYYIHTLREYTRRPGKPVMFDRAHYFSQTKTLRTFAGETIRVLGHQPATSGRVSFQGRFLDPSSLQVDRFHLHGDHRDQASFIGLFMACALLLHSVIISFRIPYPDKKDS